MIITQSSMQLSGQHAAVEVHREEESLTLWRGERPAGGAARAVDARAMRPERPPQSDVNFSQQARALQPEKALLREGDGLADEPIGDLKIQLLKLLIERFTGREIELSSPEDFTSDAKQPEGADTSNPSATGQQPQQSVGWGLIYDYYESHYESEHTSFQAKGVVRTSDGQEINVSLQLNMSREFLSEQRINIRAGDALMKDPLVINFNGTAAQLTQRSFSFDIDADGRMDQIAFVKSGSGLLALDRNGDGRINDGSELFGALSGNGFADLAMHDQDGNGWIDEADSIYSRLRIWTRDAAGEDRLMALGQAGVGAIYLGSVETPFLLKGAENETLGQVRQSGLYLSEEGGAGTVQQLDLVV